jgi:hypothetical protein
MIAFVLDPLAVLIANLNISIISRSPIGHNMASTCLFRLDTAAKDFMSAPATTLLSISSRAASLETSVYIIRVEFTLLDSEMVVNM